MLPGYQVPRHGFILKRVRQTRITLVDLDVVRGPLNQISAAMPSRKTFADDLRGEAEVGAAFCAVDAAAVAGEELGGGRDDGGGGGGKGGCAAGEGVGGCGCGCRC